VVALLYVMLLVGMVGASLAFSLLLADFSQIRLIQVIQGAALATMLLNCLALWKQEARNPALTAADRPYVDFIATWQTFLAGGRSSRLLVATGLGTAAFAMQDILLEPYGGQIMHLGVGDTTALTAVLAGGTLAAFALAARRLGRGADPYRLAAIGALVGVAAFSAVIFAAPFESPFLFRVGTALIGFGGGLFAVGSLTAAMALEHHGHSGLALGAWGAVQASAAGVAIALGGALRDIVSGLAQSGALGPALAGPATGYSFVYHLEIGLLFATLIAIGPLVRTAARPQPSSQFGLAEFPG
jgi:BCD family chlorophyll transporter-like MFS transporter